MAGDAFLGSFSAARRSDYGVFVAIPNLPLYVPASARVVMNDLTISTIQLAVQDLAGAISDEAGEFADTGGLAQSWAAGGEVIGTDATSGIYGRVFSNLPHAAPMDLGRRPGAPISRAGVDAIGLWAQRKLGISAEEAERAKWAIATSIIQRGIEGKYYVEDGLAKATPRIDMLFRTLNDTAAQLLTSPQGTSTNRARDARGKFIKRG